MKYMIHYSASAERDIDKAIDYIINNLKNPLSAKLLQQREISLVNNLVHFPYKHPVIDDLLLAPYKIRYVPINNYLLFYTVIEETRTIYIVRFLYSRRDWQRILQNYVQYDEYLSKNTTYYVHENQEEFGKQFKKEPSIMTEAINNSNNNENFNEEAARLELYDELKKGLEDIAAGRTIPAEKVFAMLREELEK